MPKFKKKPAAEKLIQYDLFTGRPIEDETRSAENEVIPLDWESNRIRMMMIKGDDWWFATDACCVLGIKNTPHAVDRLDDDEKMTIVTNDSHSGTRGGAQSFNLVNQSGLYSLIFTSRRPEAKRFKRWVTHEVLPEIRRTGTYSLLSSRAGRWKHRLKCDDAVAKKRVDQVDINKRTHSRIFAEKGGVSECASWHNAAYAGQFGDEVTAGKLRTDLEIPKWDTPLNHMGLVPLSVNHLGKAITEQAIADSKQELSPDEQVATLMRVTRAISKDTITQLGHEAGSDYVYGIVHKSKRGMLIDTVQKQLTAQ
jgi:prophage antirepressor-like protein